jgi:hypothetical protein
MNESNEHYRGLAWRSRFLRAPKIALRLSERPDFVPIGDLAQISLGLKTGADRFFFLRRLGELPETSNELQRSKGLMVEGYEAWKGQLSTRDILPAIVGPHELFDGDVRRFCVPRRTERLYLSPRSNRPTGALASYVRLGEIGGLPQLTLVAQNAGSDWWRQERPLVRDEWALPYNSAYDYGAWHNGFGAVLNGRFVGASPLDGIDSDLLGGVLNSTFALVGRLLEGMATGTEGALDVGPPAVRLIRVPDLRRMSDDAAHEIATVVAEIRRANVMPPAPCAAGRVSPHRRRLDETLLQGLGSTAGEAASLLDELYSGYGRWRQDVESVERQMQQNRREMARSGQVRSVKPTLVAGRRVWEELASNAPILPSALLLNNDRLSPIRIPAGAPLPVQEPLLEPGLITNGDTSIDLGTYARVRYAVMLRRIGFEGDLLVLSDTVKAAAIVDRFDSALNSIRSEARRRSVAYVSADLIDETVAVTIECWFQACRRGGMVVDPAQPQLSPAMDAYSEAAARSRSLH